MFDVSYRVVKSKNISEISLYMYMYADNKQCSFSNLSSLLQCLFRFQLMEGQDDRFDMLTLYSITIMYLL